MKYLILSFIYLSSSFAAAEALSSYVQKGMQKMVDSFGLKDGVKAIVYDYNQNQVILFHTAANGREFIVEKTYISAGGRGGVSNVLKSGGTPPGVHKIFKKQGDDFALYQTFDADKYGYYQTRVTPTQGFEDWKSDFVMTRIMRLQGLEGSLNNNSSKRSILFHGTQEEGLMGYHESAGCIRMLNAEVIELFDQVEVGTLVNIVFQDTKAHRVPKNLLTPYNETLSPELRKLK